MSTSKSTVPGLISAILRRAKTRGAPWELTRRCVKVVKKQSSKALAIDSQGVWVARHALGHRAVLDFSELVRERNSLTNLFAGYGIGAAVVAPPQSSISNRSNFVVTPTCPFPLEFENCKNFSVDLSLVPQAREIISKPKFSLTFRNCRQFEVKGGFFEGARNFALLDGCDTFKISNVNLHQTEGYGFILFNCRHFCVSDCVYLEGLASGVYCLGATNRGLIRDNTFLNGRGHFNWDAAIHINHCSPDVKIEDIPERTHESKRIVEKSCRPSFIYVEHNLLSHNRAQGIYCEGAQRCIISDNVLVGNNKEGACLDWGSTLNVFYRNKVLHNGERAKMSERDIKDDFIEAFPLLADGSSSCKLPGLSLDNGAFNLILHNSFDRNFGGGVKMVRSAVGNLVYKNVFTHNSFGRNRFFPKYNSLQYLGLGGGLTEFSRTNDKLDFLPSQFNAAIGNHHVITRPDSPIGEDAMHLNNRQIDEQVNYVDS